MRKYPKIKYPEDDDVSGLFADGTVYAQEKVDGANARVTLEENIEGEYQTEDRNLVFGSRNIEYKNPSDESNQFADPIEYVRQVTDIYTLRGYDEEYDGLILFGEYMVPHTIRDGYNWDKWEDKFVGFDLWSIGQGRFLNPDESKHIFNDIGIPYADVIASYDADEWINGETEFHTDEGDWLEDDKWCPKSAFGDGLAEGIVIKNPTTQTYAKMVREDFRERHQTGSMETEDSDAEKLSYQYVPDARIEKTAHKLVDEGEWDSLCMPMMQDLPKAVIKDMVEEEGFNIFMYKNWVVDFSEFRSITSDRCSQVLRRMISLRSSE